MSRRLEGASARRVFGWSLAIWAAVLSVLYAATVPEVESLRRPLAGLSVLAAAGVGCGIPVLLLWKLEGGRGRRAAAAVLAFMIAGATILTAWLAGVVVALIATAVVLVAAYGYGALLARWLVPEEHGSWLSVPLLVALGLVVVILLGIVAGVVRQLASPAVAIICLAGIGLARTEMRKRAGLGREASPFVSQEVAPYWWWVLAFLTFVGMVGAVAPEVRHDALVAHLPIARWFVLHRGFQEMRQQVHSYLPAHAHVLYAIGMALLPGEAVPKLLHFAAGVLASLVTLDLGSRLSGLPAGLAAAALVAATPLVWWVMSTAYTDLWGVLFATAAVLAAYPFFRHPDSRRAVLIGLLAGAATGVKLSNLIVVAPLLIAVSMRSLSAPTGVARGLGSVLALFLTAAGAAAFWPVRAWALTGNPVFPLLNDLFRSPLWAPVAERFNVAGFGMGTRVKDLLALPWRTSMIPSRFVEEGNIGIAYLAVLPAAIAAAARGQLPRWLWGVTLAAVGLWFVNAQYLRYLLPALPLVAVIGTSGLLQGVPARDRMPSLVVLLIVILPAVGGWMTAGSSGFLVGILGRAQTRDDYVARHVDGFRVAEFARRTLPRSARIYSAGDDFAFYYDRFFVPISWYARPFDPGLSDAVLAARTGTELQELLRRAGFTHLVVNRDHPVVARWRRPDGWLAREAFWEDGPRLEFAYAEHYLFRVDPGVRPRECSSSLLRNSGMDAQPSHPAALDGWEVQGDAGAVPAALGADTRARVGAGAALSQHVAVTPGRLYALDAQVRAGSASATARLFLQWLDAEDRVLDYSTWRRIAPGERLRRFAIACTAPAEARSARAWLIADPGGQVEFDNARFCALR